MIAIVDYDTGNLRSVVNALQRVGAEYLLTSDPKTLLEADRVLLPGVGEASTAMARLRERGLDETIRSLTRPVLGICIGMQLMCRHSEEGDAACMGIFPTDVRRFTPDKKKGVKVPHMGWNTLTDLSTPLFNQVEEGAWVYYVHSYAAELCAATIARTENGTCFSAALHTGNFYGTQFHPEKSGSVGEQILKNFLAL